MSTCWAKGSSIAYSVRTPKIVRIAQPALSAKPAGREDRARVAVNAGAERAERQSLNLTGTETQPERRRPSLSAGVKLLAPVPLPL